MFLLVYFNNLSCLWLIALKRVLCSFECWQLVSNMTCIKLILYEYNYLKEGKNVVKNIWCMIWSCYNIKHQLYVGFSNWCISCLRSFNTLYCLIFYSYVKSFFNENMTNVCVELCCKSLLIKWYYMVPRTFGNSFKSEKYC